MSLDQVANSYKQADNLYVKGMDTPHGRIKIIFEQLEVNIEKIISNHPKTEFVAFGKVMQCFMVLSGSLDFEKGESLAEQLNELYDYCARTVKDYLTEKDITRLEEVLTIVTELANSWKSIEPS